MVYLYEISYMVRITVTAEQLSVSVSNEKTSGLMALIGFGMRNLN